MMPTDSAASAAHATGFVIRPYAGEADLADIVRITNAEFAADGLRERMTLTDLAAQFRHASESFDASRDAFMAEVDGRAVGTVRTAWVDTSDGLREHYSRGAVDPEWRRRGIGAALLQTALEHMRARANSMPVDRPQVAGMFVDDLQVGRAALARSAGYEPVRWFFVMERSGLDRELPPAAPLPDGLEVRQVSVDDARAIWDADHEAFRDHWGGFDDSEAAMRRWIDSPDFDPSLFVVAWDGAEIAAAVLNAIYAEENAELGLHRGWLDSVFTRRRWRGRGLARALITRSLHLLAERGMDTAALGVDADNPSGALHLYESCGFVVTERGSDWRRPLEGTAT